MRNDQKERKGQKERGKAKAVESSRGVRLNSKGKGVLQGLLQPMGVAEVSERLQVIDHARARARKRRAERYEQDHQQEGGHMAGPGLMGRPGSGLEWQNGEQIQLRADLERQEMQIEQLAGSLAEDLHWEWARKLETAELVAGTILGIGLEEWLNYEWLAQGLATQNITGVLETVIENKAWQVYLPRIGKAAREIQRGPYVQMTGREEVLEASMKIWERQWQKLDEKENLELLKAIEDLVADYPEPVQAGGDGRGRWGTAKKREENGQVRMVLVADGLDLLAGGPEKAKVEPGQAQILGGVMHQLGIKAKELGWKDQWHRQRFLEGNLEATISFFTGLADPGFFEEAVSPGEEPWAENGNQPTWFEWLIEKYTARLEEGNKAMIVGNMRKVALCVTVGGPRAKEERVRRM